jgi:hypothetical protein
MLKTKGFPYPVLAKNVSDLAIYGFFPPANVPVSAEFLHRAPVCAQRMVIRRTMALIPGGILQRLPRRGFGP